MHTRLAFITVAAAGWLLALPGPAAAHVELVAASPAEDETVSAPLSEVRLEFTGALKPGGDHAIGVFGPDEQRFDGGQIVEVSDRVVTTTAAPLPQPGPYTVRWLVIGEDGHAIEGSYTFTYAGPVPVPSASGEPSASEPSEPSQPSEPAPEPSPISAQPASDDEGGGTPVLPVAAAVGVVAVGAGVLAWRRRNAA